MKVNHNMTAIRTNVNLNKTHARLDTATYRLSSGYKINAAKDDPAGYAILRRMNQQIRGLDQANTNAADGVSAINTGEGALSEIQAMLQRMNELAVQAANDTNADEDRANIQAEIEQLKEEINRVAESTDYNGRTLLNGETERTSYIANTNGELGKSIAVLSQSTTVMPGEYKFEVTADAKKAEYSLAVSVGTLAINNDVITITQEEIESGEAFSKIQKVCERKGIEMKRNGNQVDLTTNAYGSKAVIEVEINGVSDKAKGEDVQVQIKTTDNGFSKNAVVSVDGHIFTVTDANGYELRIETEQGAAGQGELTAMVLNASTLQVQIGSESENMLELVFEKVSTKTLNIDDLSITTQEGASKAIEAAQNAINQISSIRSKLGAYENRLNYAMENLETHSYNVNESTSRIGDTDMAEEMTSYTQLNVLEQATSTILSKANQRAETILQLLQS